MELREALKQLDINNPEHWTTDGSPLLDPLKELMGESAKVTRAMVNEQFPDFSRSNPFIDQAEGAQNAASQAASQAANGESFLPPIETVVQTAPVEFAEDSELLQLQSYGIELDNKMSSLIAQRESVEAEIFATERQIDQLRTKQETTKRKDPVLEYLRSRVTKSE